MKDPMVFARRQRTIETNGYWSKDRLAFHRQSHIGRVTGWVNQKTFLLRFATEDNKEPLIEIKLIDALLFFNLFSGSAIL